MFVFHDHFVATLSTVDDPMQHGRAVTRHPTRFVAIIGGIVVGKHVLDLFKRFPRDVRRVDVIDANLPLCHRQANLLRVGRGGIFANGAGFAIDNGSCIGRLLQDLQNGGNGGLLPHHIAKAILSRQVEFVGIEKLQDFAGRSEPQERGKHEIETILDFTVGVFVHLADGIALQADREFQSSFTSLCLVE